MFEQQSGGGKLPYTLSNRSNSVNESSEKKAKVSGSKCQPQQTKFKLGSPVRKRGRLFNNRRKVLSKRPVIHIDVTLNNQTH